MAAGCAPVVEGTAPKPGGVKGGCDPVNSWYTPVAMAGGTLLPGAAGIFPVAATVGNIPVRERSPVERAGSALAAGKTRVGLPPLTFANVPVAPCCQTGSKRPRGAKSRAEVEVSIEGVVDGAFPDSTPALDKEARKAP